MKNVLILMPSLKMGGAEKSLLSLLEKLTPEKQKEIGVHIELLVANKNGELVEQIPNYIDQLITPHDFEVYITQVKEAMELGIISPIDLLKKATWALLKKIVPQRKSLTENELYWFYYGKKLSQLSGEYDLALSYMDGTATYYLCEKVLAKKKIAWVHNNFAKMKVTHSFADLFFKQLDGIVTISDSCKASIVKEFPDYENKIYVIENLSNADVIEEKATEFYPEEYELDEKMPIILSVGRLFYQKGFDIGIDAMVHLKKKIGNFRWFIMGTGELREALQTQINNNGLENEIKLIGTRQNPYPYIKNCDVLFQPSRFEGKSIVVDEAKLLQKVVVAADYETVIDSICDRKNGIVCKCIPSELANGLYTALCDDEMVKSIKDKLIREKDSQTYVFQKYVDLLKC